MFNVCVYVVGSCVCRMCDFCFLQLLVPRCYFGYTQYFVRSAVDSSFDFSTFSRYEQSKNISVYLLNTFKWSSNGMLMHQGKCIARIN
jgi:hypothetical protein